MEEIKTLICTRCGSHHLTQKNETEYICESCDAIITKEKALNFEKEYRKLIEEGKNVDINNLRNLVKKSLEGHIDKESLIKYSQEILKILPDDTLSMFYIKYINRSKQPLDYENLLESLINKATITEVNDIIDMIVNSASNRDKEKVIKLANHFYGDEYNEKINESLEQRKKEIDFFSDVPRDVFICWSSKDKIEVDKILKALEEDGNTCWISSRNIPWDSDNYWANITKAIKSCNIFLCINSENTMQSKDCMKEIEIATSLDKKKRIEYKLDDAKEITLFKRFFTGQWITSIDDLLNKIYDLKHKEKSLKAKALSYLDAKEYKKAKEVFEEVKTISNDEEITTYIDTINILNSAIEFINKKMYEEARIKLLEINEINYTKELLDECNRNIKVNSKDIITVKEQKDALTKIEFLLNQSKDYAKAEEIIFDELAYNKDDYNLWYLYLQAITNGFKNSKHVKIPLAFDNLFRLSPDDKKEELQKLDTKLNPVTLKRIADENESKRKKREAEEAEKTQQEEARKLASEERRKREEEEKERKKGKKSVTLIVVMLIIQLVISIIVIKIKTNIILPSALDDDDLFVISLVFFVVYFFLSVWGWNNISPVYSVIEVVIYPISLMLIVYQWHIGFAIAYAVAHIILMIGGCIATYDGCTRKGTEIRDDGVFWGGMFKFGIPALLLAYELLMGLLGCN